MTGLYDHIMLERTRTPHHAGRPAEFRAQASGANPICGDHVKIFVGEHMDVRHESDGCAIMTASADLMASAAAGKTPPEIAALMKIFAAAITSGTANPALGELNALTGVAQFPSRIRCATLPWSALEEALHDV